MKRCVGVYDKCLDIASCSRDKDDNEVRRYRRNWIVLHTTTFLMFTSYTIVLPTQHQFVTNPRHPEDPDERPGLGEGDVFYSLTIAIFSIGELFASLIFAGLSSWHIKLKYLMLSGIVVLVVGGLFYGVADYGWMVLVGRLCHGIHFGAQSTLLRIYIGETSNTVRDMLKEDPEKSQLKNTNFLIGFILGTIGFAYGPGLSTVIVQIPLVDKFRWSGWYLLFHGLIQILLITVVFRENWSDLKRTSIDCKRLSIFDGIAVPRYCIVYMLASFFILNCVFALIETLQNPILGDNFGIDIKWASYIFLLSLSFFPMAVISMLIMQRKGVDNRYIFLIGLLLSLVACALVTDWQAIGGDPCDKFSGPCYNGTNFTMTEEIAYQTDNSSELLPCEICRMHSDSPYQCFWNPDARISQEFCTDCREICRSELHTLHFAQFLIGICLFGYSFPMLRITMTIIFSDALGSASQSIMMGLLISSGALSRCTAPIWGDAAYVAANHRTYLPILLLAGLLLFALLFYLILFKQLKPYYNIKKQSGTANGDVVELIEGSHSLEEQVIVESEVTSL